MCAIKQAITEGFFLISSTQSAAEAKDGVIIVQGQGFQKTLQFPETVADFRRGRLVSFGVCAIELIQDSFALTAPMIKWMVAYISI